MKFAILSLVLVLCCAKGYAFNATAVFGSQGVTGWVRFTLTPDGTQIVANLDGLTADAPWTLHELPVLTTLEPAERGQDANVGPILDFTRTSSEACDIATPGDCEVGDFTARFGMIPSDLGTLMTNDTTGDIVLSGPNSIIGRSIVVVNDGALVAATIFIDAEENTPPPTTYIYTATFFSPVAGTIYFRQVEGAETVVFGKLYHVTDSETTSGHTWAVHEFGPPIGYQEGLGCSTETIGEVYNPENTDPALGDLATRLEPIDISGSPSPLSENAFFFTDQIIALSGGFNILGRSVAISSDNAPTDIIACAPIVTSESLFVGQFDDFLLTIIQRSPYENSTVEISANYPDNDPAVSVLQDAFMVNGVCTNPSTTYNPFQVVPTPQGRTPDLFPLGDIPNKYNLDFFGPNVLELTELPLYGPNTLTSRTIQITKSVNSNTVTICSTLVPPKEDDAVLLKATFNTDPIKGGIYFIQNMLRDGSFYSGATNIVVDLYFSSSDSPLQSESHNWIISEATCAEIESGSTPEVFNPFGVVRDTGECSSLDQLRCESGDMSGKHTPLVLSQLNASRVTFSFIDSNLQLTQNYSVNGLSLVIMGAGGATNVLACTTLMKLELNDPASDLIFSTPAIPTFDRVAFLNDLTSVPPLNGMLDPSNIIMLEQVVGAQTAPIADIPCATFQMVVMTPSTPIANTYAEIAQRELCRRFLEDNECFSQFSDVCSRFTTGPAIAATTDSDGSGAPSLMKSTSTILLGALAVLLAWVSV